MQKANDTPLKSLLRPSHSVLLACSDVSPSNTNGHHQNGRVINEFVFLCFLGILQGT